MDSRDRLRRRLVGTGCGACGRPYRASGIRVLAQRENLAFVRLRCESCGTDGLALITDDAIEAGAGQPLPPESVETVTGFGAGSELTAADVARLRDQPPIGLEDVLAMRTLLAGYGGDLRGLIGDPGPGAADR